MPFLLRTLPDGRLLRLFKDGHDAAFEEIVRRYRPRLVELAAGIAGAPNADDVVQDCLAAAYRVLREQDVHALRPWLYAIVRNRSITDCRAARRRSEPLPPDLATRNGDGAADARATLAAVVDELREMPVNQRTALVKHELEGLDYARVADHLRVSPGAAKQLVYRARQRLRAAAGALFPAQTLHALAARGLGTPLGLGGGTSVVARGAVAAGLAASAVLLGVPDHDRSGTARVATGSAQSPASKAAGTSNAAAAELAARSHVAAAPKARASVVARRASYRAPSPAHGAATSGGQTAAARRQFRTTTVPGTRSTAGTQRPSARNDTPRSASDSVDTHGHEPAPGGEPAAAQAPGPDRGTTSYRSAGAEPARQPRADRGPGPDPMAGADATPDQRVTR